MNYLNGVHLSVLVAVASHYSALILAVEMQEVSCPYFFESYSVRTDSGGPGDPAKTAELRSTMTKFKEISQ